MAISNTVTGPYRSTVPKSTVSGSGGSFMSTVPKKSTGLVSTPTTAAKPATSMTSAPSSGLGQYKGVNINPGTQAEIQAQMAQIDGGGQPAPTVTQPTQARTTTPTPAVKGLIKPEPPSFSGALTTLLDRAQNPSKDLERGLGDYRERSEALSDYRQNVAKARGDIYTRPALAAVSQGREAQMQRVAAETEAALASELQASSDIYGALTNVQGQQLNALGTAAGLAQPVQIAPGSTLASPIGGETVAGGLGGYANYQTAEQVMGLIRQYPDAGYVYDQTKTPQENLQTFQNQALQRSPSYQKSTYGQPGATSVVGAAGLSSAADLTQQASELQAAANGAEANFALLVDTARKGGVNNTNVPVLNTLQQNLNRGLTSSAAVASFRQLLEDVRMQYAVILGGGAVTDSARAQANAQIPDDVSLATLMELEKSMKNAATNRIQGINQQISSISQGSVGGNTTKVGNYSYQLVNGKWQLVQ